MVTFDSNISSSSNNSFLSMDDTEMAEQPQPQPTVAQLMAELARLNNRLNQQQAAASPAIPDRFQKRPRPVLPDPEPFSGNRPMYQQFKTKLLAKLSVDREALGGPEERLWYSFGRLSGPAAAQVLPWVSIHAESGKARVDDRTVHEFFEHLDSVFLDKELQEKALADLNSLQQGSRSFGELLNVLRRLIMEAGGDGWTDRVKRGFLDAALSGKMKDNMIQLQKSENFDTYCQQLQQIADRLQERQSEKATGGNRRGPAPSFQPPPSPSPGNDKADPDAMDWEPTLSKLRQRRAKWVDAAEIAKRREEKRCIRCGSPAHFLRQCVFLPAVRPGNPTPRVESLRQLEESAELEPEEPGKA